MNDSSCSQGNCNGDQARTASNSIGADTLGPDGKGQHSKIVEVSTSREVSCSSSSISSSGHDEETPLLHQTVATKKEKRKKGARYNYKCCFQTCNNNNRMEGIKFHRLPPPQVKELPADASLMRQLTKIKKEIHRELILNRCGKLNDENRLKKDLRICNRHKFKNERFVKTICIPSSGMKREIEILVNLPVDGYQEVQRKNNNSSSTSHIHVKNTQQVPLPNMEKPSLGLWSFSTFDLESNKDSNSHHNKTSLSASTSASAQTTNVLFQTPSSTAQGATFRQHDTTYNKINNTDTIPKSAPIATTKLPATATATKRGEKHSCEEISIETEPKAKKKKSKYHWNYKCCFGDCNNTNIDNVKFHRIPPKQNKQLPPDASFERHETMNKKNLQRRLLLERCSHFERDKDKNDLRICDAHEFKKETVTVVTHLNGKSHESKFDLLLPKQEGAKTRLFTIKTTSQSPKNCKKEGNFLGMTKKKLKKNKKLLK